MNKQELIEAVKTGSSGKQHSFSEWISEDEQSVCVLGAAYLGVGGNINIKDGDSIMNYLIERFPFLYDRTSYRFYTGSLSSILVSLNNSMSFDQIIEAIREIK